MERDEIKKEMERIRDQIDNLMSLAYKDWTQETDDALGEARGDMETALELFEAEKP
jgi:hypothetical protein